MGVCAGDYDNDGHVDLYVTNFGTNVLYRNGSGGSYVDATEAAGVGDERLSTSAAFADIDNDGDLDLYVANNTDFTLENHKECRHGSIRVYCGPGQYQGASGIMYRNEGNGTFADATEEMGVYNDRGRQLGVVFGDYDEDGDADLFVANDMTPNFLFRNEGGDAIFQCWAGGRRRLQPRRQTRGRHGHRLWRLRPGRTPRHRRLQLPVGALSRVKKTSGVAYLRTRYTSPN